MKKVIFWVGNIAVAISLTLTICFVFDKLMAYKQEIQRMHDLQNNRIWKLIEDNSIQFKRLNKLESQLQNQDKQLEYLNYRDTHKY